MVITIQYDTYLQQLSNVDNIPTKEVNCFTTGGIYSNYYDKTYCDNHFLSAYISKIINGYVKFNNGFLINWGEVADATSLADKIVTFANAYTTVAHTLAVARRSDANYYPVVAVTLETITNFKFNTNSTVGSVHWIAVGY